MRSRSLIYIVAASLLAQTAQPAFAQRRGGTGPRGGGVQHYGGPRRGATTVQGPRGGTAGHAYGPRGSVSGARGAYGGGAAHATGRYGGSAGAVRGPYGGAAARATGPYGGSRAAARGPYGGTAYARNSYAWHGRNYYRPTWNASRINAYGRGFVGYPGWRAYGTYGLVPGLAAFSGLAFLSAGLLIGSYAQEETTVYVYVVNEGGQNVEYRVDSNGNVISKRVVS